MIKIVLTGPECSGKTTLSKKISSMYNIPLIDEYARTYLDALERPYNELDLDVIAIHQITAESDTRFTTIFDTDLLTTYIWMEEVYAKCRLDWLQRLSADHQKIYLLCAPDLPWVYDPHRENPHDRDRLYEKYKFYLDLLNLPYEKISGDDIERIHQAKNAVD